MWKIEEKCENMRKICNSSNNKGVKGREREVGGDSVKKISSDVIEMKKKEMEREKETKN